MKKLLFLSTVVLTVLSACAQDRKSPHETVEGKDVKVTYGRPYKKGRVIFGDLEKYGKESIRSGLHRLTGYLCIFRKSDLGRFISSRTPHLTVFFKVAEYHTSFFIRPAICYFYIFSFHRFVRAFPILSTG